MKDVILKVQHLTKVYGKAPTLTQALKDVNIEVGDGEFLAIVGTSGSGKTTLLNMIAGLDNPTSGMVRIAGTNIFEMSPDELTTFRRKHVGMVFQNYNLIPIFNVYENIILPLELDGSEIDTEYLKQVTHLLGLDEKLDEMPNHLSGGQQQRVAIARALITKPALILADEPTGNLDSNTSADVVHLLRQSVKQFRQTLIMITHNAEIASQADREIRIEDGKILQSIGR